jgi:hypothetical protein
VVRATDPCDVNTGSSKKFAKLKGVRAKSGIRNER